MFIPINDRLYLTKILATDQEAVIHHLADPTIAAAMLDVPFPFRETEFETLMTIVAAKEAEGDHPMYLAIRQSDGWMIGAITFSRVFDDQFLELGYWLAKPWWSQGIMTVAVRAASHHAFFKWEADVILASCFRSNVASQRVLEKCGFRNQGQHQLVKDGESIEAWFYVLDRDSGGEH